MQHIIQQTALSLAIAAAGAWVTIAQAQTASQQQSTQAFDIAPGPLGQVLTRFADQAGLRLMVASDVLADQQSPGLRGNYEVNQGLAQLLGDKGLQGRLSGDVILIEKVAEGGTALELSNISISGKAPGSITEGTGSYTTYSTSSSTRLNLSPQETPQSITVLTQQRMEDQRLNTVSDALAATTGIVVNRVQVGEDSESIYARGSLVNNYQIDGVPTSSSLSSDLQDTSIYDRIEIVRGATGLMSGMGQPSATVNLIRKRPTYDPQVQLSAEAGSWDRYGVGVDVSGPLNESGNIRGRMVSDYKSERIWAGGYSQNQFVLYGIGEIDLSESTLLTAGFSHFSRETNSPVRPFMLRYSNGDRIGFDASDNRSPGWSYYDHGLNNTFLSVEHQFDSGWSSKVEYNHTLYRYDSLVTNVLGTVDQVTGAGTELAPAHWRSKLVQDSLDGYVTGPFSLFGREHELIAGATLSKLHSEGPDFWDTGNYAIPDYFQWADATPKPLFTNEGKSENDEYQYSAYLSSRFHLSDATSFILGSRVTDWEMESDYRGFDGYRSQSRRSETGIFIPYAGVVHALNKTWSLYASYTKIFQPQASRTIQYTRSPAEPEEGTSYEAGVKASFKDGRLTSSLAVFRTEQDNLAVWSNDRYTYDIVSGTKTQGVELEFNGELAEGWQFGGGYAYSVTKDEEGSRILTYLPRHNVKTFTSYRLPGRWDKVTIGGSANWQSEVGENLSVNAQSSYALFNVMTRYDFSKNLSASIYLNNLLDKEYFMGISSNYGTYGPPRNIMTAVKYSF